MSYQTFFLNVESNAHSLVGVWVSKQQWDVPNHLSADSQLFLGYNPYRYNRGGSGNYDLQSIRLWSSVDVSSGRVLLSRVFFELGSRFGLLWHPQQQNILNVQPPFGQLDRK